MSTTQTYALLIVVYAIVLWLFYWFIARVPPDQTHDDGIRTASGGITAPLPARPPYESSPVDVDSRPVTLKFPAYDNNHEVVCKRVLLIRCCDDPLMWYAKLIGKEVPYLGEWKSTREYKSREPAGYINIVKFDDASVIVKEVK